MRTERRRIASNRAFARYGSAPDALHPNPAHRAADPRGLRDAGGRGPATRPAGLAGRDRRRAVRPRRRGRMGPDGARGRRDGAIRVPLGPARAAAGSAGPGAHGLARRCRRAPRHRRPAGDRERPRVGGDPTGRHRRAASRSRAARGVRRGARRPLRAGRVVLARPSAHPAPADHRVAGPQRAERAGILVRAAPGALLRPRAPGHSGRDPARRPRRDGGARRPHRRQLERVDPVVRRRRRRVVRRRRGPSLRGDAAPDAQDPARHACGDGRQRRCRAAALGDRVLVARRTGAARREVRRRGVRAPAGGVARGSDADPVPRPPPPQARAGALVHVALLRSRPQPVGLVGLRRERAGRTVSAPALRVVPACRPSACAGAPDARRRRGAAEPPAYTPPPADAPAPRPHRPARRRRARRARPGRAAPGSSGLAGCHRRRAADRRAARRMGPDGGERRRDGPGRLPLVPAPTANRARTTSPSPTRPSPRPRGAASRSCP